MKNAKYYYLATTLWLRITHLEIATRNKSYQFSCLNFYLLSQEIAIFNASFQNAIAIYIN